MSSTTRSSSQAIKKMAQMCVVPKRAKSETRSSGSGQYVVLATALSSIVLALATYQVLEAEARYLPAANYRVGSYHDFQRADDSMPALRRQDLDDSNGSSDADEEPDDADDQNAAASYRNQDDGVNQEAARGGASDGFDDNEPDGPYEETPVEQEGQADLERFFDDHLGASDRDGMDKENLPSNLIASLSKAPQLNDLGQQVLTAAPMASIQNPTIEPPQDSTATLAVLPTIQTTSFIRLPDEKRLIVTNQITRNTIGAPVKYGDENDDSGRERALYGVGADHEANLEAAPGPSSSMSLSAAIIRNDPTSVSLNIEPDPQAGTVRRQRQQLLSSLSAPDHQAGQQDARNDKPAPHGSEVVITEDEDDDRVYFTKATNEPFRIDALGGFDPEADFQDAAQELDVGPEKRPRAASRRTTTGSSRDEEEDPEGSENVLTNKRHQAAAPNRYEFAFLESPESDMYGDASETDEVTFGQDDPYQTDLEAEMRHQQYDKVGSFVAEVPAKSGSSNVARGSQEDDEKAVEAGDSKDSTDFNRDDGKVDPNDDDTDIDDDYKPLKPEPREDTPKVEPKRREADDTDEGGWVNDGADEMDIPPQSHQNFILDKAAKHDEMVRKAALDEMEVAEKQPDQPADESGQTSGDGEESQRMPNADYLKDDLKIEDDSGYAA